MSVGRGRKGGALVLVYQCTRQRSRLRMLVGHPHEHHSPSLAGGQTLVALVQDHRRLFPQCGGREAGGCHCTVASCCILSPSFPPPLVSVFGAAGVL